MSLRAILDSSPVAIPPVRPLKRSASLASLPTPPRTYHKRSLSRSHSHAQDTDSDSSEGDGDEGEQSGADDGRLVLGSKKRRTSLQKNGQEIEEEENEFWMNNKAGTNASSKNNNKIASSKSQTTTPRSPSSSVSPAPLLYRLTHRALVSPPPSRRQSQSQSRHISPPVTPKRQASSRTKGSDPIRDSPNNPFLVDTPLPVSPSDILKLESPHTPSPMDFMEKPTITYVFRGVKAEFANPLYKPASDSTEEPTTPPAHTLPLSDPEYSPDLRCPPRLLFKAARRLQGKKDIKLKQGDTVGDGETNTDAMPGKLTFARELALLEGKGE